MVTLPDATAAPRIMEHRGKEYRLRPLDFAGIAEIEQWLQSEHIAVTERNLKGKTYPPAVHERLVVEAFARASRLHVNHPDADALLCTAEGASRLIWCCIRRDDPAITLAHVRDMLSDPETKMPDSKIIGEFMVAFNQMHRLKGGPKKKAPGSKRKATRKKRKAR